MWKERESP